VTTLPARLLLAALSGVLAGLSFEPFGLPYLLPLAVAGAVLAAARTGLLRGFLAGTAFGLAFMLLLLPWLRVIGTDAWLALSALEAVFYGVGGLATAAVTRLRAWPVWVATCWVGVEMLRGTVPFGGFPWGRLSFAVVDTPVAPSIGHLGAAGTTFLVALVGSTLAWTVLTFRGRPAVAAAGLAAACLVAVAPSAVPAPSFGPTEEPAEAVEVAAVQGDVPGEGMNPFSERRVVLENHVEATLDLAERVRAGQTPRPDLVVWPENSTDIDPFRDPTVRADIQAAVDAVGVPVLVGAMVDGEDPADVYNQGIVWLPGSGPAERYSKRHPVPFGEYIPFRDQLAPYIQRLEQIPRDMQAGDRPGVLEMDGVTVGDVICFEVAYDDVVRGAATAGTQLLVVQTNNATYMGTGQVAQQFAISRLRAIETGRSVVVAATNGITGIIGPDGEVLSRAPVSTRAVLQESVLPPAGRTIALRIGPAVQLGLVLISLVSTLAGVFLGYRRRASTGAPPERARSGHGAR
jgi:apolipoprotein N-acyltransferase